MYTRIVYIGGRDMTTWRFLNWESDEQIDFPSSGDGGPALLLTQGGRVIRGNLAVTERGLELPLIAFTPDDGSAFDFFDAIAWRRA